MSQFSGPQPGYKDTRTRNKGVMRARREEKRLEAEVRDELLPPDDPRRRAVRLGSEKLELKKPRRRQRNRKNPVIRVCIGCNKVEGEPHEDYCPVVTGTLSTLPREKEKNAAILPELPVPGPEMEQAQALS